MQTGERDRLVKSILQSHWDDFELIKLDGGMRSPYPLLITTKNNHNIQHYVFRELGGDIVQARYMVELLLILHKNQLPVAKCFPIHSKDSIDDSPDNYIGTYQYCEAQKYYFIQEFLPKGFFLDRDARINPNSKHFDEVYKYYEEIGELAARIQNVTEGWIPKNQHRYISRREIAQKIYNFYPEKLDSLLQKVNESKELNNSQIYFKNDYETIKLCFSASLNRFFSIWDDKGAHLSSNCHIHNDLHFGNVLFDQGQIVGVIDFGQAQMDHRIVEISNSILALSSPQTPLTQAIFDIPTIEKSFCAYMKGFQKEATHAYTQDEIILSWEVLRLRLLEYLYQNQLGIGRITSAFDSSDREKAFLNTVNVVLNFPLEPPSF